MDTVRPHFFVPTVGFVSFIPLVKVLESLTPVTQQRQYNNPNTHQYITQRPIQRNEDKTLKLVEICFIHLF